MQIIARYYIVHIEWISGMVLFIAGTRAIAHGTAAAPVRIKRTIFEFNLLSKLLQLVRSCIEKLVRAKINKYFIQFILINRLDKFLDD